MSHIIALALNHANLRLAQSLVIGLIDFDIYTPNLTANLHLADASGEVLIIDVDNNQIDLMHYIEFNAAYEGTCSSAVFRRVTKK